MPVEKAGSDLARLWISPGSMPTGEMKLKMIISSNKDKASSKKSG
jgi:hypothetical protein